MQENNITFTIDEKEPLPSFDPVKTNDSQESFNFMPSEPMIFEEPIIEEDPDDKRHPEVDKRVDSIFGKALAATIMSVFPVASIVAIFLGFDAMKSINKTKELADKYGVGIGGKGKAAKVLSMVGTIAGGALTAYYTVCALFVFIYVLFYCLVLLSQFVTLFDNLNQSFDLFGQYMNMFDQYSSMYYY